LLCTESILFEIADGLASIKFRAEAARIVRALESNLFVEVVAASKQLFFDALELYEQHQDKDWGMTDCASFVVMRESGLREALTVDEHFRQVGFRASLLEDE
jgi:predicted nucleic acid-binding protein